MTLESLKNLNLKRFSEVELTKNYSSTIKKMLANKNRYITVQKKTGVPWVVIAAIHVRESDLNFTTQLAQGDPLSHLSTHVPRGQGPYFGADAWERAALIALEDSGGTKWINWTPAGWTTFLEKYNGLGYANRGKPSPYVWNGTNQYSSGKYIADGQYSSSAVDTQPGCVALILGCAKLDPTININDLSKSTITPTKETQPMNSIAFNWKTSLAGLIAIATAVSAFVSTGIFDGAHITALLSAVVAGIGLIFGKDANVTGGTVSQNFIAPKAA